MPAEETPSGNVQAAVTLRRFPSVALSRLGPCAENRPQWLHLKDLGNKNPTCKNLSIALILWHFIKMLAMKSEPIFLAFSKLQNINISPKETNQLVEDLAPTGSFCSMNESALFAQQIQSIVNVRFLQQGWEVTHERRPQALERKVIPQAVPPKGWLFSNANIRHHKKTQTCFQRLEVTRVKTDTIKRGWANTQTHTSTRKASQLPNQL